MKTLRTLTIFLWITTAGILAAAAQETNIEVTGIDDSYPYGPFYCQARCLASCVETGLAPSLEACTKFCPPFDRSMPCPPNNADCWRNCGIPSTPRDKPPPPAVTVVKARHVAVAAGGDPEQRRVQDPFMIELTWDPVPTASLYIVELYPLNREPRPGENNFFRALTSFPIYTVRKEDECTIYDIRVFPVNAYGIGAPQYTRIEAPRPVMTGQENFFVRSIGRDQINENFVIANIEYALSAAWPVLDVELTGIRVRAVECRGMSKPINSNKLGAQSDNAWYPFYDILVEKYPMPRVQLAFLNEVVKADCLFQMRVAALTTRCNSTTQFDSGDGGIGIDFRINCLTAEGFSCAETGTVPEAPAIPPMEPASMPVPPPVPSFIRMMLNETFSASIVPQGVPLGIPMPQEPPPMPRGETPDLSSMLVGSINENSHPLLIDYLAINSQPIPALCDIETLDVQPTPSMLGSSLIDLTVSWSPKNSPTQRPPSYFIVRYGPIVRSLVEDARQSPSILTGQENIVRTGIPSPLNQFVQGPPERQINVLGLPKNVLLSFQVCAVYDPSIESLITWESVPSQHVDLLALQPNAGGDPNPAEPSGLVTPSPPMATDDNPMSIGGGGQAPGDLPRSPVYIGDLQIPNNNNAIENPQLGGSSNEDRSDVETPRQPIVVQVGIVDARSPPTSGTFWMMLLGGVFLSLLTGLLLFFFVVRLFAKRDPIEKLMPTPFPQIPIAMITKPHQPQDVKEKVVSEEKIALP